MVINFIAYDTGTRMLSHNKQHFGYQRNMNDQVYGASSENYQQHQNHGYQSNINQNVYAGMTGYHQANNAKIMYDTTHQNYFSGWNNLPGSYNEDNKLVLF